MYDALLKTNGITTYPAGTKPTDLILVEAAKDTKTFEALRRDNPDAVMIACGTPTEAYTFDEIVDSPDDLMRAVHAALGQTRSHQELAT